MLPRSHTSALLEERPTTRGPLLKMSCHVRNHRSRNPLAPVLIFATDAENGFRKTGLALIDNFEVCCIR